MACSPHKPHGAMEHQRRVQNVPPQRPGCMFPQFQTGYFFSFFKIQF